MSDNMDEPERPNNLTKYHSKLVGVTFEGRQAVISTLNGEEPLRVRREADNKYDSNAVAVDVMQDKQWIPVGYIAKDKNQDIAKLLDNKGSVFIKNGGITGGKKGNSYGINVYIEYSKAPVKAAAKEEPKKEEEVVTKGEVKRVLASLLKAVGGDVTEEEPKKETKYTSVLLGKSIFLEEVNGHKRLEGFTSGSRFPDQFYAEFDGKRILEDWKEKFSLTDSEVEQIKAMWDINRDASTGYGTAVHAALENYDRNFNLGDRLKKVKEFKNKPTEIGPNKALNRNALLKKIVEDFHKKFGGDYHRFVEEFIWDKEFRLCGSVDRIKVVDLKKKVIRIQDFKTDADIHEKTYQLTNSPFYKLTQGDTPKMGKELLDKHWLQLSFYAYILERAGWKVEGLDIYWLNPAKLAKGVNAWEEYRHDVIDITEAIIGG